MFTVPETLAKEGWTKPYVVTEFGPRGPFGRSRKLGGACRSRTTAPKGRLHLKAHPHTVSAAAAGPRSYVFLWGQEQEKTHTWYGMFLPEGNRTAAVDALSFAWTGKPPAYRSPSIAPIQVARDGAKDDGARVFAPGTRVSCSVDASDPEVAAGELAGRVRRRRITRLETGGDREPSTPPIDGAAIRASGSQALLGTPVAPAITASSSTRSTRRECGARQTSRSGSSSVRPCAEPRSAMDRWFWTTVVFRASTRWPPRRDACAVSSASSAR